jgi:hypothetical protein
MPGPSGIYIKPANRGKFTASSKRAGQGVQEHARSVLKKGSGASAKERKRAVFAQNAKKWARNRKHSRR